MRLKRLLRWWVCRASTYSGISALRRWQRAKHGVRILAYHGIETPPTSALSVSVESFREQMRFLKENCTVISLDQFAEQIKNGEPFPDGGVILTFDDGFQNFFASALPVLREYALPATCFVIASQVDSGNRRFMNADELASALEGGLITVGSHSLTHRSIARIGERDAVREMTESKTRLEALLGEPIRHFCYPYGTFNDFDHRSESALKQGGYASACTSINGTNLRPDTIYRLRRTKVEWGDSLNTFKLMLRGGLDAWIVVDFLFRFAQRPRERPVPQPATDSAATTR